MKARTRAELRAAVSDLDAVDFRVWCFARFLATKHQLSSREILARELGMSEDQLTRIGKRLKKLGLLETSRVHIGGKGGSRVVWQPLPYPWETTSRSPAKPAASATSPSVSVPVLHTGPSTSGAGVSGGKSPSRPAPPHARDVAGKVGRPALFSGRSRATLTDQILTPKERGEAENLVAKVLWSEIQKHRVAKGYKVQDTVSRRLEYLRRMVRWILLENVDFPDFLDCALMTFHRVTKRTSYPTLAFLSGPFIQGEFDSEREGGAPVAGSAGVRYDAPDTTLRGRLVDAGYTRAADFTDAECRFIVSQVRNMRRDPTRFPKPDPEYADEITFLLREDNTDD